MRTTELEHNFLLLGQKSWYREKKNKRQGRDPGIVSDQFPLNKGEKEIKRNMF